MAPESSSLHSLANPLVTPEQLTTSSSQLDGVPSDLEASIRYAGAQLTQAAGILLRLPQEIIARAIVILSRFYVGAEGGSVRINAVKVPSYLLHCKKKNSLDTQGAGCLRSSALPDGQAIFASQVDALDP